MGHSSIHIGHWLILTLNIKIYTPPLDKNRILMKLNGVLIFIYRRKSDRYLVGTDSITVVASFLEV